MKCFFNKMLTQKYEYVSYLEKALIISKIVELFFMLSLYIIKIKVNKCVHITVNFIVHC